jgi:hypothetical protein
MPYLIRRAEENTSVAGQTSRELGLIKAEQKRKRIVSAGIKKSFDSTSKPFFLYIFTLKKSETVVLTYFYDHFGGIEYLFFKNGSILVAQT